MKQLAIIFLAAEAQSMADLDTTLLVQGVIAFFAISFLAAVLRATLILRRYRRLLGKYPDQAYAWISDHSQWIVLPTDDVETMRRELADIRPTSRFRFAVPQLNGRVVNVFGRDRKALADLHRFLGALDRNNGAIDDESIKRALDSGPTPWGARDELKFYCTECHEYISVAWMYRGSVVTCPRCKERTIAPYESQLPKG